MNKMNNHYLQLKISAPAAAEELLSFILFGLGAEGLEIEDPSIIAHHLEQGTWDASVFDLAKLELGQIVLKANLEPDFDLVALKEQIEQYCPKQPIKIETALKPNQDWLNTWREHFPLLPIGERLLISPFWLNPPLDQPRAVVKIAPGMAFGTGDHATTALAANLLEQYLQMGQRLVDIGCGSGILAIAALKLGAAQALAIDYDGLCAPSIAEHRQLNDIAEQDLPFIEGNIISDSALQKQVSDFKADLIISNIVADVLMAIAPQIGNYLRPHGLWLVSGIIKAKEQQMLAVCQANGLEIIKRLEQDDWLAFALRLAADAQDAADLDIEGLDIAGLDGGSLDVAGSEAGSLDVAGLDVGSLGAAGLNDGSLDTSSFAVHSFGCKVNQEEAAAMANLLLEDGWQQLSPEQQVAVYLINTCAVTQTATRKARSFLRSLRQSQPRAIIIISGCYAQLEAEDLAKANLADIIIGLEERAELIAIIKEYRQHRLQWQMAQTEQSGLMAAAAASAQTPAAAAPAAFAPASASAQNPAKAAQNPATASPIQAIPDPTRPTPLIKVGDIKQAKAFKNLANTMQKRARAFLKIEDGCNAFCHYCIIPYARGRVRSLAAQEAISQAKGLLEQGHREIVLSGIHIGVYGSDLKPSTDLATLIEDILKLSPDFRLRLGSLEPQHFNQQIFDLLATEPQICNHLHIPLQSGCDQVLAAMNRHYSSDDYAKLCQKLRQIRPDIALSCDIIIGYPGETEQDFEQSLAFCQKINFAGMHIFPFSAKKGTVAYNLPYQNSKAVKTKRAKALQQLAQQMSHNYRQKFYDKQLDFLAEQIVTINNQAYYQGLSNNYLPILVATKQDLFKQLVQVKIIGQDQDFLYAQLDN